MTQPGRSMSQVSVPLAVVAVVIVPLYEHGIRNAPAITTVDPVRVPLSAPFIPLMMAPLPEDSQSSEPAFVPLIDPLASTSVAIVGPVTQVRGNDVGGGPTVRVPPRDVVNVHVPVIE